TRPKAGSETSGLVPENSGFFGNSIYTRLLDWWQFCNFIKSGSEIMTDNQFNTGKTSNVSEQAAREAERLKNQAKSAMHSAAEQAKEQGRQAAEQAMDRVGQETEKLANAERAAARQLRQDNFPTLARYMEQVADGITGFADQ